MRPGARAGPPGRSPNANPVDPQSADRPLVTITEDAQQPSITKPAQQPGRPTHFASAGSRGLEKARGEWSLVTMAWNIKRMFTLMPA
jgi:hypothetical protein